MTKHLVHAYVFLLLCAFLSTVSATSAENIQRRAGTGSIFDKTSLGVRFSYGPPDYLFFGLRRTSPDGRYVARLVCGDGEVGYLAVYRKGISGWRLLTRGRVSRVFEDVGGCAWVPHHGHWLLVSAGGADYGEGMLALWTGNGKTRILRHAKTPDAAEGFNVRSVSSDGRVVIYEHFGANSPDPDYKRNTRRSLILPRS